MTYRRKCYEAVSLSPVHAGVACGELLCPGFSSPTMLHVLIMVVLYHIWLNPGT